MADQVVQISAGSGTKIDVSELTVGANTVERQRVVISDDSGATGLASVTAKGTQGTAALSVQQLNDSGRTHVNFYATGAASGTTGTETAITLTRSSGTSATTTGTSFVVTSGKRFRITSLTFASRGHATGTAQVTTFSLRINTGGAVTTTSTPLTIQARTATPATALAWDRFSTPIESGYEIIGDGTLQIGVTANAVFVTNAPTWDVLITGYEY